MSYRSRRVKEIRKGLRLSQAGLAKALGLTRGTVTRWESSASPVTDDRLIALELLEEVVRLRVKLISESGRYPPGAGAEGVA